MNGCTDPKNHRLHATWETAVFLEHIRRSPNTHDQLLFHFALLAKPSKPRGALDGYNNHGSGWGRSKFTSKVHTPTFFFSTDDEPNASSPPESFAFTSIHTKSTKRGKRAVFHDGRHPCDRYGDAEPHQQYEQREPDPK